MVKVKREKVHDEVEKEKNVKLGIKSLSIF